MATTTITTTEYTDDLDGGRAAGTVSFSLDGVGYEIDLSKKNKTAMDKALKPYVEAARKVKMPRARGRAVTPSRRSDLAQIREWATRNGLSVSTRGRIAADIVAKYDAGH